MSRLEDFALGLYEKALPAELSWPDRLEQAGAAGFSFVEFSVDDSDARQARLDWTGAQRREFRLQVEESGLYVPTMALSGNHRYPIGSTVPEVRKKGMKLVVKAINLASDLGIRVVQLSGYDELDNRESTKESGNFYSENVGKCVRLASRRGIILAIENMDKPFMDSMSRVMSFVRKYNSPYLQVYADLANSLAMGKDIASDLSAAAGHIAAMHIKDAKPGIVRSVPFHEGIMDFNSTFKIVKESGYTGMLIIEMWADEKLDAFTEIKKARDFIYGVMKNVWAE